MDKDATTVILFLFGILFGWLFLRTNANHAKSEDVRKEMAEKVKDLYEENKIDRAQHNHDMRKILNSIHEMTMAVSDKIEKQNVMAAPDVKEYVSFKLEPLDRFETRFNRLEEMIADSSKG